MKRRKGRGRRSGKEVKSNGNGGEREGKRERKKWEGG